MKNPQKKNTKLILEKSLLPNKTSFPDLHKLPEKVVASIQNPLQKSPYRNIVPNDQELEDKVNLSAKKMSESSVRRLDKVTIKSRLFKTRDSPSRSRVPSLTPPHKNSGIMRRSHSVQHNLSQSNSIIQIGNNRFRDNSLLSNSVLTPQNVQNGNGQKNPLRGRISFNQHKLSKESVKTTKLKKVITHSILESAPFSNKRKYSTNTRVGYSGNLNQSRNETSNRSINGNPLNKRRSNIGLKTPTSLHHEKKAINPLMSNEKILQQTPISQARSRPKLSYSGSKTKNTEKIIIDGDYSSPSKNMLRVNNSTKNPNFMSAISEYNMALINSSKLQAEEIKFSSSKKKPKNEVVFQSKWSSKKEQRNSQKEVTEISEPKLGHFQSFGEARTKIQNQKMKIPNIEIKKDFLKGKYIGSEGMDYSKLSLTAKVERKSSQVQQGISNRYNRSSVELRSSQRTNIFDRRIRTSSHRQISSNSGHGNYNSFTGSVVYPKKYRNSEYSSLGGNRYPKKTANQTLKPQRTLFETRKSPRSEQNSLRTTTPQNSAAVGPMKHSFKVVSSSKKIEHFTPRDAIMTSVVNITGSKHATFSKNRNLDNSEVIRTVVVSPSVEIEARRSSQNTVGTERSNATKTRSIGPQQQLQENTSLQQQSRSTSLNITQERFGSGAHDYGRDNTRAYSTSHNMADPYGYGQPIGVQNGASTNLMVERKRKFSFTPNAQTTNFYHQQEIQSKSKSTLLQYYEQQPHTAIFESKQSVNEFPEGSNTELNREINQASASKAHESLVKQQLQKISNQNQQENEQIKKEMNSYKLQMEQMKLQLEALTQKSQNISDHKNQTQNQNENSDTKIQMEGINTIDGFIEESTFRASNVSKVQR